MRRQDRTVWMKSIYWRFVDSSIQVTSRISRITTITESHSKSVLSLSPQQLDHPNIIQYLASFIENNEVREECDSASCCEGIGLPQSTLLCIIHNTQSGPMVWLILACISWSSWISSLSLLMLEIWQEWSELVCVPLLVPIHTYLCNVRMFFPCHVQITAFQKAKDINSRADNMEILHTDMQCSGAYAQPTSYAQRCVGGCVHTCVCRLFMHSCVH